jgi:WhiB family redox-sensing transcriptional regulator
LSTTAASIPTTTRPSHRSPTSQPFDPSQYPNDPEVIAVFAVLDDYAVEGLTEALVPGCTDAPEQFFSERPEDLEQAKVLCRVCPIREACLAGALDRREPWGVWGGEVFDRGRIIARKRGPGRPRKEPAPLVAGRFIDGEVEPAVALVPHMRIAPDVMTSDDVLVSSRQREESVA